MREASINEAMQVEPSTNGEIAFTENLLWTLKFQQHIVIKMPSLESAEISSQIRRIENV